ncbi:MAG: hypothetical protein KDK25_04455 [Leptospiraceae bacterium]|nr:hypothetical protein [Leptospiraceae bacterium]
MLRYANLFPLVLMLLFSFCGSEEEAPCFEKDQLGSCSYLCSGGDTDACLRTEKLGIQKCLEGEDLSSCDIMCSTASLDGNFPPAEPFCKKLSALCDQPANQQKDLCSLQL